MNKVRINSALNTTFSSKSISECEDECHGGLRTKGIYKESLPEKSLVTVITVVYNGEDYIEKTIQSVLEQSYDNIEYLIIDGGSSDGTLDIIQDYEESIDYWISEKDEGIYDAMNKGIKLSSGDIIGILNADDWYNQNAIEEVVNIFKNNEDVSMVHGAMNVYNKHNRLETCYGKSSELDPKYLAPFNHPTCFVSREVYEEIGVFDRSYSTAADYDFMLRFLNANMKAVYTEKVLTNFRQGGITTKVKFSPLVQIWNILRKNGYSLISSGKALLFRIVRDVSANLFTIYPFSEFKSYLRKWIPYHKD